jgi:hypothetical protein
MSEIDAETAIRYYKMHLKTVSDYQKRNPEKMREKNNAWNKKVKETDPVKYQAILDRKRAYYLNVRKPKLDSAKQQLKAQSEVINEIISPDLCNEIELK